MFCDYQVILENTANLKHQTLSGGGGEGGRGRGEYSKFLGRGENLIWGDLVFYGGLYNPLETMAISKCYGVLYEFAISVSAAASILLSYIWFFFFFF